LLNIPRCFTQREAHETWGEHIASSTGVPKGVQITAYTSCFEEEYGYMCARVFRFNFSVFHVALLQEGNVTEHFHTCELRGKPTYREMGDGLTSSARHRTPGM
jgi:hypothetical protein